MTILKTLMVYPKLNLIVPSYSEDWSDIAPSLGCRNFDCRPADAYGATLYVDDEGRFNEDSISFSINGEIYFGNAMIMGTKPSGESSHCPWSVVHALREISFEDQLICLSDMHHRPWTESPHTLAALQRAAGSPEGRG